MKRRDRARDEVAVGAQRSMHVADELPLSRVAVMFPPGTRRCIEVDYVTSVQRCATANEAQPVRVRRLLKHKTQNLVPRLAVKTCTNSVLGPEFEA